MHLSVYKQRHIVCISGKIWIYYKDEKRKKKQGGEIEICTSHPDSHGESGYRQVLFPPVGKKKTTSLPSDFKKCCHFLHSIFKGREIPFNTCHPRKATILLFVIRTAAFFSPRLFAGDNLSLSRAFDVSVERNITSDFSIAFSLLKLYHLITDF